MSDRSNEPETILRPSNESVIAKLFVFAIGLAVIPLGLLYAIMNGAADGLLELLLTKPEAYRTFFAAVAAVLAVNMILGTYAVMAWREPLPASKEAKQS